MYEKVKGTQRRARICIKIAKSECVCVRISAFLPSLVRGEFIDGDDA